MEENKSKKNGQSSKRRKILTISLIIFAVLFTLITILAYLFLDPFLKKQIEKSVNESSKGQYTLYIGDLNTDIWTGNAHFTDLKLVQDTAILRKLKERNPNENFPFIILNANSASISNFRWLNYIIHRDLKVGKVVINEPDLAVAGEDPSESLRFTNKNFIELLPAIIAGFAGSLRIEELVVNSGKANYKAYDEEGIMAQKAEDIFIDITEIQIDTVSKERLLYSEDITFSLKNYQFSSSDKEQSISISEMDASLSDSTFHITRFRLSQNIKKTDDNNKTDFLIHAINGKGVDFRSFFYGKKIIMDQIMIERPSFKLVTKENNKKSKQGKGLPGQIMIPEIVSGILQSFTINLISVRNGIFNTQNVSNSKVTAQSAENVNIDITRVEGATKDSLKLAYPDLVSISLNNYELKTFQPFLKVKINSFEGSTATGTLKLNNLKFDYFEQNSKGKTFKVNSTISSAEGSGFNFKTVLDQQKVIFKTFILSSPDIKIDSKGKKNSSTETNKLNRLFTQGLPEPITKFIKSFEIDKFSIRRGSFSMKESGIENPVSQQIEIINTDVIKLHTESPKEALDFQSINISISNYILKVGKDLFSLVIPSANISSSDSKAVFRNVKIVQDHPPGKVENHYTITIPAISSESFDIKKAIRNGKFSSRKIDVNQMRGEFLLHKVRPSYAEKMPNELVRGINFYFKFDTVNFNNAFVSHTDATEELTTLVTFENGSGRLLNLTNDKKLMSTKTPAVFNFTTYLFGKGRLDATVQVSLLSPSLNGSYKGNFAGIDGKVFNPLLRTEGVQIESGVIDSAFFNIGINNGSANGTVTLLYNNLDVELLDKKGKKSRLKSLLGNFIIKNSNPNDKEDEPRIEEVDASRVKHDSFFFFLWRPILEGVLKTTTKGSLLPEGFTEK